MKLKLQNYRVIKKIGQGGMGLVYVAEDLALGRLVALKLLAPYLVQDPEILERFRFEARSQARLIHPNITMVYSFLQEDDKAFLVLEFVDGETLESRINREGRIVARDTAAIFRKILGAVDYAHGKGVIHRDIKPGNIAFTSEGSVKLMDFGIALNVAESGRLTKTGHVLGTPHYMAPEQIRSEEVTFATDIYALGITLFEMLTGRLPFDSKSDYEVRVAQINLPPPSPRSFGFPDITGELEEVILKALAKAPEDRFASAGEFRQALEAAVAPDHLATVVKGLRLDKSTRLIKAHPKSAPPPPEPGLPETPTPPPEPPEPPPEEAAEPRSAAPGNVDRPPPDLAGPPGEELSLPQTTEPEPEEFPATRLSGIQEALLSPVPEPMADLAVFPQAPELAETLPPPPELPEPPPEEAAPPAPAAPGTVDRPPPDLAGPPGEELSLPQPVEPEPEEFPATRLAEIEQALPEPVPEPMAALAVSPPPPEEAVPPPPEPPPEEAAEPQPHTPVVIPSMEHPAEGQERANLPLAGESPPAPELPLAEVLAEPRDKRKTWFSRPGLIFLPLALLPLLVAGIFFRDYLLPGSGPPPKATVSLQPQVAASSKGLPPSQPGEEKAQAPPMPSPLPSANLTAKESLPAGATDQPEKGKPVAVAAPPPPGKKAETPPPQRPTPDELRQTIRDRLAANGFSDLEVQVEEGKGVVISGNVKQASQKNEVIKIVNALGLAAPKDYSRLKVMKEAVAKTVKKSRPEAPAIPSPIMEGTPKAVPPEAPRKPLPPRLDRDNKEAAAETVKKREATPPSPRKTEASPTPAPPGVPPKPLPPRLDRGNIQF